MDKFRKDKSIAVVAKEGGAKLKAMSRSEKEKAASKQAEYEESLTAEMTAYYLKLAEEKKSNECASSSSKHKMTMLEILKFYETHHKFSIPRKVLIHESFCRYMLTKGITKEALCDFFLTKDVELNITSCDAKVLMCDEMHNKDELKARIGLALSLKELSCDLSNTCLNSIDCLERWVLNENPNCYFVAAKDKLIMQKLLQLPGVAVIGGRRGNLFLKEPSLHQTKFVENKLKGNEVADVGECVLEQIGLTENSTGKRKNLSYADDETEMEKSVANNRRVKQKLQNKTEVEVAKEGGAKWKAMSESEKAPYGEPRCRTLFMGRLDFSISEADVKYFFRKVARVNEVRFSKRKKGARFGHVEFYTAEAAKEALKLNGQKLRGHVVHLDYAEKRPNLAEMFASGSIDRNGLRDGSGGRHGGRGRGGFYGRGHHWGFGAGRGRHWGFGAGRGRVGGLGAGRVRHGGFGAGSGRHEGRDW